MSEFETKKTYGLFDNPLNKKLISELNLAGEKVLVFPPVRTEALELTQNAADYLQNLTDFDWLIFTDVFAADYFIAHLGEFGIDFFDLDDLTICAFGEAVADRLRFVQVHADVIPSQLRDDAVFSAISNFAGFELGNSRFLVVHEKSAGFPFMEKLRAGRASVVGLPIYEADFADDSTIAKLKSLLMGGAIDELVFSSPEDLLSLRFLAAGADLMALLNETRVSAVSEIVFQTLQENGFRPLYFHSKQKS